MPLIRYLVCCTLVGRHEVTGETSKQMPDLSLSDTQRRQRVKFNMIHNQRHSILTSCHAALHHLYARMGADVEQIQAAAYHYCKFWGRVTLSSLSLAAASTQVAGGIGRFDQRKSVIARQPNVVKRTTSAPHYTETLRRTLQHYETSHYLASAYEMRAISFTLVILST